MSNCSNRRYLGNTWNVLERIGSTFILGRTLAKANQLSGLTIGMFISLCLKDDICFVVLHVSYTWYVWNVYEMIWLWYVCDMIWLGYDMLMLWHVVWYDVLMISYMLWCNTFVDIIHVTCFMIWYVYDIIWYVEGHVMCMTWHNKMYSMNDTIFNPDTCFKGYVVKWYDMKGKWNDLHGLINEKNVGTSCIGKFLRLRWVQTHTLQKEKWLLCLS